MKVIQYEYIIQQYHNPPDDETLNFLGEKGWELVSMIKLTLTWRAYFKRVSGEL